MMKKKTEDDISLNHKAPSALQMTFPPLRTKTVFDALRREILDDEDVVFGRSANELHVEQHCSFVNSKLEATCKSENVRGWIMFCTRALEKALQIQPLTKLPTTLRASVRNE